MTKLLQDQKLAALTALIFDRLTDSMKMAAELADEISDDSDIDVPRSAAIIGVVTGFMLAQSPDSTVDQVRVLVHAVCELLEECWGPEGEGDIDETLQRLVPDAFAGEEES